MRYIAQLLDILFNGLLGTAVLYMGFNHWVSAQLRLDFADWYMATIALYTVTAALTGKKMTEDRLGNMTVERLAWNVVGLTIIIPIYFIF